MRRQALFLLAMLTALAGCAGGPQYRIDPSGPRISSTRGAVSTVEKATPDGGTATRFSFEASFDQPYAPGEAWRDSGVSFIARLEPGRPPAGSTGISLPLKPVGFTEMELYLVQEAPEGNRIYYLPLTLNDGQWKRWKIPFAAFLPIDGAPGFDLARPVALEAYIPFAENWNAFHFRGPAGAAPTAASCALEAGAVGFWRQSGPDDGTRLATFDDDRDTMPFSAVLYGSSAWTDNSEDAVNPGVMGQVLVLERRAGGPEGNALVVEGKLVLDPAIVQFHEAGQAVTLFLKAPIPRPAGKTRTLSFLVRSELFARGELEVQDEGNDRSYGAAFTVSPQWARVTIAGSQLVAGGGTFAEAEQPGDHLRLQMAFELPPGKVEQAAASGTMDFSVWLDSFSLEP